MIVRMVFEIVISNQHNSSEYSSFQDTKTISGHSEEQINAINQKSYGDLSLSKTFLNLYYISFCVSRVK